MSELIPWPDSSEYQTAHKSLEGRAVFHTSNSSQLEHYERARAEAAMARLRRAVKALRDCEDAANEWANNLAACEHISEVCALAQVAIGEIPPA